MPRLISSLSRILKFFTLSWLSLVGLWAFLPSPTIHEQEQHNKYIQRSLRAGDILHTIYSWSPSFSTLSGPSHLEEVGGRGLIIDWRLVSDPVHYDSVVLLEMGRDLGVRINLTDAILKVQKNDDEAPSDVNPDGSNPSSYVSSEMTVQVGAGTADDLINMPWFYWADRILFQNQMHGSRVDVQLQVVAHRHTGTVEIWNSAILLEYAQRQNLLDMDFDKISPPDRSNGVLASFSNIYPNTEEAGATAAAAAPGRSIISTIKVADMEKAELPSKTYRIRSLILTILSPFLFVVFFLLFDVLTPLLFPVALPILGAYIIIVLICWSYYIYHSRDGPDYGSGVSETTRFADWCSRFPMTRHVYSFISSCCCCCRCCLARPRRGRSDYYHYHRYWPGEKRQKHRGRVVIWGPAGPVYEE